VVPSDSIPVVSCYRPIVTLSLNCTVLEILVFEKYHDLETPVRVIREFIGNDPIGYIVYDFIFTFYGNFGYTL